MPDSTITFSKQFIMRFSSGVSAVNTYEAKGSDDLLLIRDAAIEDLPASFDDMPLQIVEIEPFGAIDEWKVKLSYAPNTSNSGSGPTVPQTGDSLYTFDTSGGTKHMTQSLEAISSTAPEGSTAPDHKGAIGVTKDAVEGIDITVPVYNFKETHYIDASTVTEAYKKILSTLTGAVNNNTFNGYPRGEVFFAGASGSYREGFDDWEIVFNFAQSDNRTDLVVGSMTGLEKLGWEYLEVYYEEEIDENAHAMIKKPSSVDVHRVYQYGNFGALGI